MIKWLRLERREKKLLAEALLSLMWAAFTLRWSSLPAGRPPRKSSAPDVGVERLVWAIEAASGRFLKIQNCLVRALAAQQLFERHGYRPKLRIGAVKHFDRRPTVFQAHAWLENDGRIMLGRTDEHYVAFPEIAVR